MIAVFSSLEVNEQNNYREIKLSHNCTKKLNQQLKHCFEYPTQPRIRRVEKVAVSFYIPQTEEHPIDKCLKQRKQEHQQLLQD